MNRAKNAQELIALIGSTQTFEHNTWKNADGTPMRWRLNGSIKTFKRNDQRIRMPLKYGMGYSRNDYMVIESVDEFYQTLSIPQR